MTTKDCGCTTATCGCCEGTEILTPMPTANRPGLPALRYRVGTHGSFLETMKARLAGMTVADPCAPGLTPEITQPLAKLTTRDPGDPSIALLDAWATAGDVLTFYQERIANEGYLRTATERRSVLELARLVGYTLRPGVASTVYLAYTLEDTQVDPVEIPVGARSQSVPGPGEQPQSFETVEKIVARPEWNNLQVRLSKPQNVTFQGAPGLARIFLAGTATNLKKGDLLLFVFDDFGTKHYVVRTVDTVEARFADDITEITLVPLGMQLQAMALVQDFVAALRTKGFPIPSSVQAMIDVAEDFLAQVRLGLQVPPSQWVGIFTARADAPLPEGYSELLTQLGADLEDLENAGGQGPGGTTPFTDPSEFVNPLLKDPNPQARSSLRLSRNPKELLTRGSDAHPQLLTSFAPRLKGTFYTAWANANLPTATPTLEGVFVFRTSASLFGSSVPDPGVDANGNPVPPGKNPLKIAGDEDARALFLDQPHEAVTPGSYALIQSDPGIAQVTVRPALAVQTVQRMAYGISGKTTKLSFAEGWWQGNQESNTNTLRSTLVHAQTEPLTLAQEPIDDPVEADPESRTIELQGLHRELTSGRWIVLSGERADIEGVSGVKVSELLMISALVHDFDQSLPGDKIHTTLILATPTAYVYDRKKLTVYGNVVKATHGETRNETLGSGDGSKARQSFELKQPPLTFVPAPTPSGVESTLKVTVNDVEWHEASSLAGLGPTDRRFVTLTDDESKTTVVFGNGQQGSRLPTGAENVKAVYRNGIGKPGNVGAEQISLLQTRPLGVKSVINPLRASGGADREDRDQARDNVPLAVMALDRVVSVKDYADFTRTFAGIGKAAARELSDGSRELVHLTIAGADDIPIDVESDLYRNLLAALRRYGDPDLPIAVEMRELIVLVIAAKVRTAPDYQWEPVATAVRAALVDTFGFAKRSLGQPAQLCEVIGCIQNVEGVAWVDVDAFGGIPEKKLDWESGTRRLLTLDELARAARDIVDPRCDSDLTNLVDPDKGISDGGSDGSGGSDGGGYPCPPPGPAERVDASVAAFEHGVLRPAQLAIVMPSVPDTIVLNPTDSE
jgi:predicted phage baseplate assembly protein